MAAITTQTLIQPNEVVNGGVLKATPMNARFDVSLISPHIADAERMHVVPVIGQALYDTLMAEKDGTISNYNTAIGTVTEAFSTAAYETLWKKYLMQLCGWATYYEALPFINMQTGANGTFVTNPEFAQNAGVSGTKFLQDQAKRRIQSLTDAITEYLCANAADFTDYDNTNCPTADCKAETDGGKTMGRFGMFYATK